MPPAPPPGQFLPPPLPPPHPAPAIAPVPSPMMATPPQYMIQQPVPTQYSAPSSKVHGEPSGYLRSLLKPNEVVLYYRGWLLAGKEICGTNRRMIYLSKSIGTKKFHDVSYNNIAGVSFKSDWSLGIIAGGALLAIMGTFLLLLGIIPLTLILWIVGILMIIFARTQVIELKMIGGNVVIRLPKMTISDLSFT